MAPFGWKPPQTPAAGARVVFEAPRSGFHPLPGLFGPSTMGPAPSHEPPLPLAPKPASTRTLPASPSAGTAAAHGGSRNRGASAAQKCQESTIILVYKEKCKFWRQNPAEAAALHTPATSELSSAPPAPVNLGEVPQIEVSAPKKAQG